MIYNYRNRSNDTTESQKEKRFVLMLMQEESVSKQIRCGH